MSEHINFNPEQEPRKMLVDDCSGCGERYLLESSTVDKAYWFADSPRHSFAQCQCPNCEYRTIIFLDEYGKEALTQHGVEINEKITTPPQNVIDVRAEVDAKNKPEDVKEPEPEEYEEVPTYELTHRHEEMIKRFGETITAITEQAPELFMGVMSDPAPPQTMPQRWV